MKTAIYVERIKAKRRGDLLLAVGVGLLTALSAGGRPQSEWQFAEGYSAMTLNLALMNAVVMPLTMAAVASRLWDVETKGNGCRLLYTLQSRESLFAAKALWGMGLNVVLCLTEGAVFLLAGRLWGFTQALDALRALWLLGSTFAVNALLFFALLFLSVRSGTQVAPLAVGLGGSLLGVFTAYMPERIAYCLPWAYYVPMAAMRMHYDKAERIGTFEPLPLPVGLLAVTVLCAAAAYALAWRAVRRQEV